jgi:hypothetical protein
MIRILGITSVLFATVASFFQIPFMSSEPIWLLVWGGALIGVSLQLRTALGRKAASAGARRGMVESFGHAKRSSVNRKQKSIEIPLLSHVRAGTQGSAF